MTDHTPGRKSDTPAGPADLKERHRAAEIERLDTHSPAHKVPAGAKPAAPATEAPSASPD